MTGSEFYIKSEEEMRELFSWAPEVIDNTLEVAEKCSYELDCDAHVPAQVPRPRRGADLTRSEFRKECEEGLARRYGPDWRTLTIGGENVSERFEYEYKVICEKGFADYFFIVQEYVRWAKRNGIGVGPGRGSAAGAIVAYAMDITTFDPLDNGLMFERFLSPQRSEMPDIDMDFDDERRLEVVEHVRQLYGPERVCHVITYSTIKAKQAINDAARVLDFPVWQAQKLSKMLNNDPRLTLENALHKSEKHPDQYSPDFEQCLPERGGLPPHHRRGPLDRGAAPRRGRPRLRRAHHAATPVNDHVPTKIDTKGGVEITQYEGHSVADMGLLKMDFLGLRTLTVISKALANIKANHGHRHQRRRDPLRRPGDLQAHARGPHRGRLPDRVRRHDLHDQEHAAHRVQAGGRPYRPVPPGPSGRRHGHELHQPHERSRGGRLLRPAPRRHPG